MEDTMTVQTEVTEQTSEGAQAVEEVTADDTPVEVAENTAPPASDVDGAEPVAAEETVPASTPEVQEIVFTPVYNGEVREIRASDTQEITTLLQLGMKQRDFLPVHEKLRQLAHESGAKSVTEFVNNAFERNEQKHREEAIANFGQEQGEKFYEFQKSERSKAFARFQEEEQAAQKKAVDDRNAQLAEQFIEMNAVYPEYASFKDVPKEVVELSFAKNIPLLDAMTRFKREEDRKVAAASATAQKAAQATTGAMSSAADVGQSSVLSAFLSGARRHARH